MHIALSLAKRGVGITAPNPSVGCVIVKDGRIIGRGHTAEGGRPHAETIAIARAGKKTKGSTAYITLEPCSHHGKTPPCVDALIKAGMKRVIIAAIDPNPKVSGSGVKKLKAAGIKVEVGLLKKEAEEINAGFFKVIKSGRPLVTLKLALTSDGKITMPSGKQQWFTCEEAKNFAHFLRYRNDAIMVGANTIITDDPALTCRLPGLEKFSPVRVVVEGRSKLPEKAKCRPAIIFDGSDLKKVLHALAEKGITRLLVEGGGKLAESFLKEKLVDTLYMIEAPDVVGEKSAPDIKKMLMNNNYLKKISEKKLGRDKVSLYQRR